MHAEPRRVTDPALIAQIQRLRVQVWRAADQLAPGALPGGVAADPHDDHAQHVAVIVDGRPVAAARFCFHSRVEDLSDPEAYARLEGDAPAPIASYNRMVVDPAWQGRRLSTALDELVVLAALGLGARSILGFCTLRRARSLEPLGFRPAGPLSPATGSRKVPEPRTIVRLLAPRCEPVTDPSVLSEIFRLRAEVWRAAGKLGPDTASWTDGHDEHARHYAVMEAGRPIAAGRLCVHDSVAALPDAEGYGGIGADLPGPVASINRLVVHPSAQGRGLSGDFDLARLAAAAACGCRTLIGMAHPGRDRSLLRRGFRPLGPARHAFGDGTVLYKPLPAAVATFCCGAALTAARR